MLKLRLHRRGCFALSVYVSACEELACYDVGAGDVEVVEVVAVVEAALAAASYFGQK